MFFCWDGKKAAVACRRNGESCDFKYYQRSQKEYVVRISALVPGFIAPLNVLMAFCRLV